MPAGRVTDFTQEMADLICERLIGGESLRSICRDEDLPHVATVCRWLTVHETFREQYARAREVQADTLFDEILEIADDARNDWMERRGEEDAGWVANGEHIQRAKLRVDARKWMAGKLQPKKYGEKITTEMSGPNGGPIETRDVSDMDRAKAMAFLATKAKREAPGV